MKTVYLDNSATTKVRKKVLEQIIDVNENYYGNPSSLHRMGLQIEKKIEESRKNVSKIINSKASEIYFTGGGTESNNIAIISSLSNCEKRHNIVTTKIEHSSVYNTINHFKDKMEIRYVEVDKMGKVDQDNLNELVDHNTILVSIMHVNNEVGIVQDLNSITKIIKDKNKDAKIHIDAVQSFGKIKIDTNKLPVDTIAFSSHKIHGPKGVGGLFVRSGSGINCITFGGGQEKSIRPGTENTPGIVGFGEACRLICENFREETEKLQNLKYLYAKRLSEEIKDIKINSSMKNDGAPHILSISFKNVKAEVLVHYLEQQGIFVSTGSACSSKAKTNRILESIKLDRDYLHGTIRISLGLLNTEDEVEYAVHSIKQSVEDIRKIMK
ncbi:MULTISPECIES: cysteine desulfurase family protein [unclassified Sedimentibacter]|uniref:cysteine desulfurase family protein n=1 Tax=unclassified Sedimentibacter TaxID=2649220 RepID=UPI0027E0010B|nr:cysteine desulfurase family protein [Sedimentibacter sp. MB35-C1]WMJ76101.1 cysteine desulfurase family protein [Sedimentibacter sp. MB35-C1]